MAPGIVKVRSALATFMPDPGRGTAVAAGRAAAETVPGATGSRDVVASAPTATPAATATRPRRAYRGSLNMKVAPNGIPSSSYLFAGVDTNLGVRRSCL
jgi:hypothetical protein